MATLLSIPANKTLLRRHLCLQINELVGKHIVQEKRTAELATDFIPINPTTKVKVRTLIYFLLKSFMEFGTTKSFDVFLENVKFHKELTIYLFSLPIKIGNEEDPVSSVKKEEI